MPVLRDEESGCPEIRPKRSHDNIMLLFCPTRQTDSEKRYPANGFATVHGVVFGILVYGLPKQPLAADRRACVTGGRDSTPTVIPPDR
jgi:hypothetical protein